MCGLCAGKASWGNAFTWALSLWHAWEQMLVHSSPTRCMCVHAHARTSAFMHMRSHTHMHAHTHAYSHVWHVCARRCGVPAAAWWLLCRRPVGGGGHALLLLCAAVLKHYWPDCQDQCGRGCAFHCAVQELWRRLWMHTGYATCKTMTVIPRTHGLCCLMRRELCGH